jgi:multisubunit Na+/H+ antiporter MnhG subunit
MKTILIELFVAVAVLVVLTSVLGMLCVRDPYQRMHYISPPASLSAIFIAIAIWIQRGVKPESFKALLIAGILIGMNSIVTHAAARAFRIAEVKDWDTSKDDEVPLKPTDEPVRTGTTS